MKKLIFFLKLKGEPNNWRKNEYCVELSVGKEGRWNDHPCDTRYGYLCKKRG